MSFGRRVRGGRTDRVLAAAMVSISLLGALVASRQRANAAPAPRWRSLAPVPTPRTEATAVVLDGEIYLMGGYAPPAVTVPVVEIYNPRDDAWRPGPPLPLPVNHAAGAVVDDTVYVMGGYLGYALGSQFSAVAGPTDRAFALVDGSWRAIASLPEPRAAGGAAVVHGKVYVVGGVLADGSNAGTTLVYDPGRDEWTETKGLPFPRQHLGVASARDRVFAVGGRVDLLNSNVGATDYLPPGGKRWRGVADLPTWRGGLGVAVTDNGFVVAAGGEGVQGTYREVEALDLDALDWRRLPGLPTPRHGLGVVAIGNVVYALGGGPQPSYSYSSANEAIDLSALRR